MSTISMKRPYRDPDFLTLLTATEALRRRLRAQHYNLDERRQSKRTTVDVNAKLLVEPGPILIPCEVLNLTHRGAKLRSEGMFVEGEIVEFTFDNYRTIRRARVTWAKAPELGIEFDEG